MVDELLLFIRKKKDALVEESKKTAKGQSDAKLNNPLDTFFSDIPSEMEEDKWLLAPKNEDNFNFL